MHCGSGPWVGWQWLLGRPVSEPGNRAPGRGDCCRRVLKLATLGDGGARVGRRAQRSPRFGSIRYFSPVACLE